MLFLLGLSINNNYGTERKHIYNIYALCLPCVQCDKFPTRKSINNSNIEILLRYKNHGNIVQKQYKLLNFQKKKKNVHCNQIYGFNF